MDTGALEKRAQRNPTEVIGKRFLQDFPVRESISCSGEIMSAILRFLEKEKEVQGPHMQGGYIVMVF